MKSRRLWILGLCLLMCLLCGAAAAEGDFQRLNRQAGLENPHVAAWLEIPGASMSLPVMYHPTDDAYYGKHAPDGTDAPYGSVYIQARYNAAGFTDPVTILYGSSAAAGTPFRNLQERFSGRFDQCRSVFIHTQEGTREYVVFAAIPYSSVHILHYYDFRSTRRFDTFFDGIFSTRALGMHLDENNRPEPGADQVLILSTGLRGDSLQRYLVMAKLVTQ